MSHKDSEWMGAVMGVQAPWTVADVRLTATGTVSVLVEHESAMHRSWFQRRPASSRRLRWDHVSLAGRRCEVVLNLPEGLKLPELVWTGESDMPFTRGLARLVLDLMLDGATMTQLCRMLELPISDLWKYKYRLDQGSTRVPGQKAETGRASPASETEAAALPAPAAAAPASTPVAPAAPAAAAASASPLLSTGPAPSPAQPAFVVPVRSGAVLPAEGSPVWLALLKGKVTLDVQALSLKLLLSKLLREAASHQDADLHRQAAQSLHRYFERNLNLLGHEARQLIAHAEAGEGRPAAATELPDVSDPLWMHLLTGERDLDVRTLSLRLLLSKLRGQARTLQNDEVRMLKLVELHRFFEKNQAVLRHEISQIQGWSVH